MKTQTEWNDYKTDGTIAERVTRIAAGNIGACKVAIAMADVNELQSAERLAFMGIKGERLWVAFKRICNQDLTELLERSRKVEDVIELEREVNEWMKRNGCVIEIMEAKKG